MGNLIVQNTGLDHRYLGGVPIVEARYAISDLFSTIRRISSLAANTDPYILKLPLQVRKLMTLNGEGDRITKEFLEDGAKDILPALQSRQRWIPEGVFGGKYNTIELENQSGDISWSPNDDVVFVKEFQIDRVSGAGKVTAYVNGTELGTFYVYNESPQAIEGLRGANQDVSQIVCRTENISVTHYIPAAGELGQIASILYDLGKVDAGVYITSTEVDATSAYYQTIGDIMVRDVLVKTTEAVVVIAAQIPNINYSIGDEISFVGVNYCVWKIDGDIAYCIIISDDISQSDWGDVNTELTGAVDLFDGVPNCSIISMFGQDNIFVSTLFDSPIIPSLIYDVTIPTIEQTGISWRQALVDEGNVEYPRTSELLVVDNLTQGFNYCNPKTNKVYEVNIKHVSGSADVSVSVNGVVLGTAVTLADGERNDDLRGSYDLITNIDVSLENATPDFKYDFVLDIGVEDRLPSPRFEFDSIWNEGYVIYRWQNMDNRSENDKLNYTSMTNNNIRIDTNIFDTIKKYIKDALRDYVLMRLYDTIGYDKKYIKYKQDYELNRQYVAFWIKKDGSTQTQYNGYGV